MAPRRSKRSTASASKDSSTSTTANVTNDTNDTTLLSTTSTQPTTTQSRKKGQPAISNALGLTQAQFSSIVSFSITFSHWLDVYRSAQQGTDTTFCNRYFHVNVAHQADSTTDTIDTNMLMCTESDIAILTLKYQTTLMRMILYLLTTAICWSQDPLLKTWNYANAISPLATSILALHYHKDKDVLVGPEIYSLGAILVLTLLSNYEGREGTRRFRVLEGVGNMVLLGMMGVMSFWISQYLILGPEHYLVFGGEMITEGARGLWNIMIGVEYSSFMFVMTFALFYLNEWRKRSLLFSMGILMLVHAFYQLPKQKEFWQDASGRQSASMIMFFVFMAGAMIPSFDKAVIKK